MSKSFDLEKRLGAFPSPWDDRNRVYSVPLATTDLIEQLPEEYIDLLAWAKKPYNDQGNIGSCVGHDGDIVYSAEWFADHPLDCIDFSAGWLYDRSRFWANIFDPNMEGSTNLGLMKAMQKDGVTTEECAPTDTVKPFTINPCSEAYNIASDYKICSYHYVNKTPLDMKAAMYGLIEGFSDSSPLVSAFPVYSSFKDAYDDGVVPLPTFGEALLGGHSSPLFGWKKIGGEEYWVNVGSWGNDIGDDGKFYLPINYPFYDVWRIKLGQPEEPSNARWMCQLFDALKKYFGCNGGE